MRRSSSAACLLFCLATVAGAPSAATRSIEIGDLYRLRDVSEPAISPDGAWVAYTVTSVDVKKDRTDSDVWMTSWDGSVTLRLTSSPDDERTPRFSPDNKYLAFLSSRGDEQEVDQIWLLDRGGGEAVRLTEFKGSVVGYDWSPDSRRLAIVAEDPDPDAPEPGAPKDEDRPRKPIVIDRFQFKQDIEGYLTGRRTHLYLFDLASRKAEPLTTGPHDERQPVWSPDGGSIAFVTKRGADPDRHSNWDIHVIEARAGGAERRVTENDLPDSDPDFDSRPVWSPDGRRIAFVQGGAQSLIYYALHQTAVVPATGGPGTAVTPRLDRNHTKPLWSADGSTLYFLLEEDRSTGLASVPANGGEIRRRLLPGRRMVFDYALGKGDRIAVLAGDDRNPQEVFALEGGNLRPLSRVNDALMADLRLGAVEEIDTRSPDGTSIGGLIVSPPDAVAGTKHPAVLRIHGGPVGQFDHEFELEWQLLAAQGYLVVASNPRGSSGRGAAFQQAIWADWGNKDAADVLAAVDEVVRRGLADPERLGVGGWSYGGMLTNYVIARDRRFKAAVSGASVSNILAGYGTDQYIREYEAELGPPWKTLDVWTRISFPFLHADRITTPTLFLCGEDDFNVPLLNSEQMYQALRSLGVDTQLVIYPGEYHGLRRPSYLKDRYERYLAWYGEHLASAAPTSSPPVP